MVLRTLFTRSNLLPWVHAPLHVQLWCNLPRRGHHPAWYDTLLTGLLSGTPTSTGYYSFYVTVTDSSVPNKNSFQTYQSLLVTNASGLYVTGKNPFDESLGHGVNRYRYLSTNGASTYTWTVSGGRCLPAFRFSKLGPNAEYLIGEPTVPGTFVFTLRATDTANSSNFADHTFTFRASPVDVVLPREHIYGFDTFRSGR